MVTAPVARETRDAQSTQLWNAVDRLLATATLDGIAAHRLQPLAAARLRRLGSELPEALARHERSAAVLAAAAVPMLKRVRASCDGPLVLIKGLELSHLYPPGTRPFGDFDLIAPDPEAVQAALLAAGFGPGGNAIPKDHHHLQPLVWQQGGPAIEVHRSAFWPAGTAGIPVPELLEASIPSSTGIAGVLAPSPAHHTLILAMHGWQHGPLRVLRDLIDVAAAANEPDRRDLERTADAIGIGRIWRTTRGAADAIFYGGPRTPTLRTWARSLEQARARSPREVDIETLLAGFWWMSPPAAFGAAARLIGRRLFRAPVR